MRRINQKIFAFVVLMFVTVSAMAQGLTTFSIAGFEPDPQDITARQPEHEREDDNGDRFSIIKVRSNNPDDDFNAYQFSFGQMECQLRQMPELGELWIYVQRGAKYVTISRKGYKTISKYDLRTTIEEGTVYNMSLSVNAPTVYHEIVQFKVEPADAKALITVKSDKAGSEEKNLGTTDDTGTLQQGLELGIYTYKILANHYHTVEGRLNLKEVNGIHTETIKLRPNFSNITLKAGAGVKIYVNNELKGTGTWTGRLTAGSYNVVCKKDRHKDTTETIKVEENNDRVFELAAPTPIAGTLFVMSSPQKAQVFLDGKLIGETPLTKNDVLIGSHKLEVKREGFKPESKVVNIKEKETLQESFKLTRKTDVTISSVPSGCNLYIDGKYMGRTPYKTQLTSGKYNIRIEGGRRYKTMDKKVSLSVSNPNLTYTLKRRLQQPNAFYIMLNGHFLGMMGAGMNIGFYAANFNFEGYASMGFKKESVYTRLKNGYLYWDENNDGSGDVYDLDWNWIGSYENITGSKTGENKLMSFTYGGKFGYGIICGTRFRITPQIGAGVVTLTGDGITTSSVVGLAGVRFEFLCAKWFGLHVNPEYSFSMSKQEGWKFLSNSSSSIKALSDGLHLSAGFYFNF